MPRVPVSCVVTQNFGANPVAYRPFGLNGHEGKDYGCANGTPIYNAKAGVVGLSISSYGAYGTCVVVRTVNGEGLIYAHLRNFIVTPGQKVAEGQVVGYTDNTGNSTGPHLHFGYQPAYMSNLSNGYFGCANPDVLFNQGGSVPDYPNLSRENHVNKVQAIQWFIFYITGNYHSDKDVQRNHLGSSAEFTEAERNAVANEFFASQEYADAVRSAYQDAYGLPVAASQLKEKRDARIGIPDLRVELMRNK